MITGQFNGFNIIALPAKPGFSGIQVKRVNTVGSYTSPFSLQTSTQLWPGSDMIQVHCSLPPMKRGYAAAWDAWMAECNGMLNTFMLPLPYDGNRLTAGAANVGVPVVNGAGANMPATNVISTKGWLPNTFRVLMPGDWIQVGLRIYTVLDQVNADSSGDATITVWPSIREQPTANEPIIIHNPQGIFRMASNTQQFSISESGVFGFEFDAMEVR